MFPKLGLLDKKIMRRSPRRQSTERSDPSRLAISSISRTISASSTKETMRFSSDVVIALPTFGYFLLLEYIITVMIMSMPASLVAAPTRRDVRYRLSYCHVPETGLYPLVLDILLVIKYAVASAAHTTA